MRRGRAREGAGRGRVAPAAPAVLAALAILAAGAPRPALAYRPFESTDATVAGRGALEAEVGLAEARFAGERLALFGSTLRLNWGFAPRVEAVLEGEVARRFGEGADDDLEILDPAADLKAVLFAGEDHALVTGLAVELTALLPGTEPEARRHAGFEGVAIASFEVAGFACHGNLGGGLTREGLDPFLVWGAIVERPLGGTGLRLALEVNGEDARAIAPEERALAAAIFEPADWIALDAGFFRSLREAPEWGFTVGFTIRT